MRQTKSHISTMTIPNGKCLKVGLLYKFSYLRHTRRDKPRFNHCFAYFPRTYLKQPASRAPTAAITKVSLPIDLENASQFSVRSRGTPAPKCVSRSTELYRSHTSQGASAQVLLYGATVVSWKSPSSSESGVLQERLFVSSKSALDGSKPVSGFESR